MYYSNMFLSLFRGIMACKSVELCSATVWFFVQIASILSDKIEEETIPPAGCTCQEPAAGETFVRPYCGHEMSQNCSRHVMYTCTGINITVTLDCPYFTTVIRPDLKYAHYCVRSPSTPVVKQCGFISDCTEVRGLCGFPSLKAVKEEIKKLPRPVDRRVHCNLLHNPRSCKSFATEYSRLSQATFL
jgi:hypothetical protein